MYQFNTKFEIGQEVYHVTPDSTKGIILDIIYYVRSGLYYYIVAWSHENQVECAEIELSESKSFT